MPLVTVCAVILTLLLLFWGIDPIGKGAEKVVGQRVGQHIAPVLLSILFLYFLFFDGHKRK